MEEREREGTTDTERTKESEGEMDGGSLDDALENMTHDPERKIL